MSRADRPRRQSRRGGFTLIEVLAAVFLTTLVITAAVSFFINLSNSATRAAEMMRRDLHAAAVLERLGRDLEAASFVTKKDDVDPLDHPWYFVADSQHAFDGADRVKFLSRSQKPRANSVHGSDLAQIVYFTERQEDDTLTLYRWLAFGLPVKYPIEFPDADDDRCFVLADGLQSFSMRFLSPEGEWVEEWDTTLLVRSGQLPLAVDFSVSFADGADQAEFGDVGAEPEIFMRSVLLSSPPIDLPALIQEKVAAVAQLDAGGLPTPEDAPAADATCESRCTGGGGSPEQCQQLCADPAAACAQAGNFAGMPGVGDLIQEFCSQ